ncbi:hypothetical protein FRC05_007223 [Tulasnella sp. 425]|nr:hypothetical protein FRC05_007223 [Tulasnella sp. 425]
MSNTTETLHLFYSRPGSSTPPTNSLQLPTRPQHTRPPISLPSSLILPRGPSHAPSHPIFLPPALVDCAISLVETRLERLDIHLTEIYSFNAQRLHYASSRYLVGFAQFILDCDASNNTSPNWEAALTILIRKHIVQRKNSSPAEVERYRRVVQTLIDTPCEPDVAIRLFRDEGIEEDVWARGMSGTTGPGDSMSAVGSFGKRAKLPSYVDNLKAKSHQVDSDRIRATLADFFDLQRFGIDMGRAIQRRGGNGVFDGVLEHRRAYFLLWNCKRDSRLNQPGIEAGGRHRAVFCGQ